VDCTPPASAAPLSSSPCSSWLLGDRHCWFYRKMSREEQSNTITLTRSNTHTSPCPNISTFFKQKRVAKLILINLSERQIMTHGT
jgi:hypothetical protein